MPWRRDVDLIEKILKGNQRKLQLNRRSIDVLKSGRGKIYNGGTDVTSGLRPCV
jgi:hypothetical protein